MDNSPGLRAEARGLEALQEMQKKNWEFRGLKIIKAVRTNRHPVSKIRRLEGHKIDLVVLFDNSKQPLPRGPMVMVLQVKSTHKSYKHFSISPNRIRSIKCVLIFEYEELDKVIAKLTAIFTEVLTLNCKKNPFLRPRIPIQLL